MGSFKGFSSKGSPVQIPKNFFTEIIPDIDNAHTLKILLHAFHLANQVESQITYFEPDKLCDAYFSADKQGFWKGLELAVEMNWLLTADINKAGNQTRICMLNTPRNKAAIEAIRKGELALPDQIIDPNTSQRPDIFRLYEENIGPLTPIIADSLKDLEENYPIDWITKAIQVAVKNSARSLRYIEVVLQNWQEEGKYDRTDRRRRKKTKEEFDPEGYTDGEFSDFIEY
jgi:DnaD/phage-associated family protein